jgi:hypothetical protein
MRLAARCLLATLYAACFLRASAFTGAVLHQVSLRSVKQSTSVAQCTHSTQRHRKWQATADDLSESADTQKPSLAARAVQRVLGKSVHDKDISQLALPALMSLLVDPVLSLVDTFYTGKLGPTSIASLGPCTSIFHFCFNTFRALTHSTTRYEQLHSHVINQYNSLIRKRWLIWLNMCLQLMLCASVVSPATGPVLILYKALAYIHLQLLVCVLFHLLIV